MLTPQQIDQISFGRATFGGYDMDDVDEFLTPLTEDYVTLYKENALLKSKMRVLVGKLEEYRKNEAAMKEAIVNAQKTCDKMVRDAEIKAAQMLSNANDAAMAAAAPVAQDTDAMVAAEDARVEEARKVAAAKIDELQEQLRSCIQALDRIKSANAPAQPAAKEMDVADEIAQSLEALVGTTVDAAPKAEPKHPIHETTTSRFANLQFGPNYDPTASK
jgi:cell division initiation protein